MRVAGDPAPPGIKSRGEFYFARHTRHAPEEPAALAADVRAFTQDEAMEHLTSLYDAIVRTQMFSAQSG